MTMKLTACLALLLSIPAFGQDMSMFRGNSQHSGIYRAPGVPSFSRVKWKFSTGGRIVSSPAMGYGVVYFGSADHFLYAVDLEAGTQKWKFKTDSGVASSPALYDGAVYFGSYDGLF